MSNKVAKCKQSWTIIIPDVPPSQNSHTWTQHWTRYRAKLEWQKMVFALCREAKIPPCEHVRVAAMVYFPVKRKRDLDNFEAPLKKMTQDALVLSGVIPDDTPEFISWRSVEFAYAGKPRTEVTIASSLPPK